MTLTQPTPAPWTPPRGNDVEVVEVGHYWDAVRAPKAIGERTLELLGKQGGAAIADYCTMYWLISPGSAYYWQSIRQVQVLTTTTAELTFMGMPPGHWRSGPGLHWRIPVGPNRYLTDTEQLRQALLLAAVVEFGSDEEADR
ncbi:hypothetical protein [Streptomyces sparsogenes]|uniref:hypothetical protein n=1 Tax=Streptomyces sparsogenes TaxID=67365 RepID=UPI0008262A34|nr:hypothetical protein [Streptomyces sparsogenes]